MVRLSGNIATVYEHILIMVDGVTVNMEARDSDDAAINGSSNRLQTLNIGETTRTRLDSYRKAS